MRLRGEFILALSRVAAEAPNWPNNVRREEFSGKSHTLLLLTSRSDVVKLVLNLANNFYESFRKFVSVINLLKKQNKTNQTHGKWSFLSTVFNFVKKNFFFPKLSWFPTSSTFSSNHLIGWVCRLSSLWGKPTDPTQWTEQTLGDSEGWGSLAGCSPWSCKELDMAEQLNNREARASS